MSESTSLYARERYLTFLSVTDTYVRTYIARIDPSCARQQYTVCLGQCDSMTVVQFTVYGSMTVGKYVCKVVYQQGSALESSSKKALYSWLVYDLPHTEYFAHAQIVCISSRGGAWEQAETSPFELGPYAAQLCRCIHSTLILFVAASP